jgi:TatD DNase family protein
VNEEAFLFPKMLYVCTRTEIMYTDSHTHLYLDAFSGDREEMVGRAVKAGVTRMLLPNIDSTTMQAVFSMAEHYPASCYPMMGLHPTSVKNDYLGELGKIEKALDDPRIVAIGETGIDLYRDKSHFREQVSSFKTQIGWAREMDLPLVIHARDSFSEIFDILEEAGTEGLRGVFHSFTGGPEELEKALSFGFMIGINGIVTFRNSDLGEVVRAVPVNRLLLETDAPFLAPVPFRGRRNESSYLVHIAEKVGEIHNLTGKEIGTITTRNALRLFQINDADGS